MKTRLMPMNGAQTRPRGGARRLVWVLWALCLLGLLALLAQAQPAEGSDCPPDDPSRSDCSAAASTARNPLVPAAGAAGGLILAAVVNGMLVSRQTIPPDPTAQRGSDETPAQYTLDLKSESGRTQLKADGQEILRLTAQVLCNKPEVDAASLTRALAFSVDGPNADWVKVSEEGMQGGRRRVALRAWRPRPDAALSEGGPTVRCTGYVEGYALSAPLRLTLEDVNLEIVVKFEPEEGREYRGCQFDRPEGFAADGEDALTVVVYARQAGKEPEQIETRAELELALRPAGAEYVVERDASYNEPGKVRAKIRAARPLLYTAAAARETLQLRVEGKVKTAQGEEIRLRPKETTLAPRLIFLKLWVVPGARPGTSEAGVLACLAPDAAQPLPELPVELAVETAGAALTLRDPAQTKTDNAGTARWTLAYSGLTWANLGNARFQVRCRALGPKGERSQATGTRIDVNQNVHDMLVGLREAQAALELTNPEWRGTRWHQLVGDWFFPNSWRGFAYNMRNFFFNGPDHFTCGRLRDRIWNWWAARRFGRDGQDPDATASMNGIEIGQYFLAPIHVFAGFHLSGTDPNSDPYMIDPWWDQEWGDKTLLTWTSELAKLSSFLAGASIMFIPLSVKLLGAGSVAAAWAALKSYLLGTGVSKIVTATIGTSVAVAGYTFRIGADTEDYLKMGYYQAYRQPRVKKEGLAPYYWLSETAERWRREKRTVPPVEVEA